MSSPDTLTDVAGLRVGHASMSGRPTGCTVVLCEEGAVAAVDIRGGSPGTREIGLLDPVQRVEKVHGLVLSGGSAFGLDTASGVVRYLEERGIGHPTSVIPVPIVPAAILFDLGVGDDPRIRPDADAGYRAASAATNGPVVQGSVGAGVGATVGKMLGADRAMRGGLGSAALGGEDGLVVAALVAVNAVGDVVDPGTGEIVAGARSVGGDERVDLRARLRAGSLFSDAPPQSSSENTTIGVVATNASLSKTQVARVARMAHDGLARTIVPSHTPYDGDLLFGLSTGELETAFDPGIIGAMAAEAVADAILRGVRAAESLPGVPSSTDGRAEEPPG